MAEHLGVLVKDVATAVDRLVDGDIDSLVEPELADAAIDLSTIASRVDAVLTEVVGRVDASKIWANDGSRSCAAWLARAAHRDRSECAALVRRARRLRTMPLVELEHRAGRLSARHVDLLRRAAEANADAFADDEAFLVDQARALPLPDLRTLLDYWRQQVCPDEVEDDAAAQHDARAVHLSPGLDGTGVLDAQFEPVGFALFSEALRRIERELWEADWADARRRAGDRATVRDLARSNAQRRYDALLEMARRATAAPPDARLPRPLVTVLVDHQTLVGRVCELSGGPAITPGQLLPLLAEADIERAVFGPGNRVIELGRRSRLFAGGARRAVEIRDRACTHPTCTTPAEQCDVDHVVPWEQGGRTDPDNGTARCPQHHPGRHRSSAPPGRRRRAGPRATGDRGDPDTGEGEADGDGHGGHGR